MRAFRHRRHAGSSAGRLVAKLRRAAATTSSRSCGLGRRARDLDAELVHGDLSDRRGAAAARWHGCDAVFHLAARYEVGIPASERDRDVRDERARHRERPRRRSRDAQVPRIVYVSTVNVFGNTHGEIVDETYRAARRRLRLRLRLDEACRARDCAASASSSAHRSSSSASRGRSTGPGDHSELGGQLEQMRARASCRMRALSGVGVNAVHVDDVVDGILLAYERRTARRVVRARRRDHDPRRDDRRRRAPQRERRRRRLPAADGARSGSPRRSAPLVGRVMGNRAEPPRAHRRLGRRDVLGDRREGAHGARRTRRATLASGLADLIAR